MHIKQQILTDQHKTLLYLDSIGFTHLQMGKVLGISRELARKYLTQAKRILLQQQRQHPF
jgi:hypothetical protein